MAVVPIFFDGHGGRVFQSAGHLHYTLRMALLIEEFRIGAPARLAGGRPPPRRDVEAAC